MADVIERLRAANPVPDCPPPPIEDVWRRVESDERHDMHSRPAGSRHRRSVGARLPSIGGVIVAGASVTAVLIAVLAIALLGHRPTNTKTPSSADSPPALTSLHAQADRLLGSIAALDTRVHTLRGYPIVINAWASWCDPCRKDLALFASASARYGKQVAFLGADTDDTRAEASSFLVAHPTGYPSYEATNKQFRSILPSGLVGLPTTVFIDPAGRVVYTHVGEYDSFTTLEHDIANHLLSHNRSSTNPVASQRLTDVLGVLRRPQTAADRRVRLPQVLRRRVSVPGVPPLGTPDRALIRIAARTPWGKNVIFIPLEHTSPTVGALGQQALLLFDGFGGSCCVTAQQILSEGGAGSTTSVGRGRVAVVLVLPDGVARISILAHYDHPVTLTAVVHNNVAAFYAPGYPSGLRTETTWYGPSGNVIKRFTRQGF